MKIKIEVSGRHIHLSEKDLEKLFGKGYQLKKLKNLSQEGEFAAREEVTVCGKRATFQGVRVVGPCRKETQLEISATDARHLGVDAPVKLSGSLKGTPGIRIEGPKGKLALKKGVIIAQRHLHVNPEEAKKLNLKKGSLVAIRVSGGRGLLFENVAVRIADNYKLDLHIDTDEANAAGVDERNCYGELVRE